MEPLIQYAKTSDGVNIAFWTMGEGQPVVDMGTPPFSHIQMEWQLPEMRNWYERFARNHQFVRFDGRGTGLSDRELSSYSIDGLVLDLEAVVERLEIDHLILLGEVNSGAAAIRYAANHPKRVEKLILWCAYALGTEFFDDPGTKALRDMLETDWRMFTEASAHSRLGWSAGEPAQRFAALIRQAVTPNVQAMLMDALRTVDVTEMLPHVQAPTLVMQREDRGADVARRIAGGVPNGRVVLFKGSSAAPYLDDADAVWQAIAEFIGDDVSAAPRSEHGSVQTIVFTDLASSTALTQRLGDAKAQELVRAHNSIVREALAAQGGTEIKHTGDGIMASFATASGALECAVAIQRSVEGTRGKGQGPSDLAVHIGLNAGEPVAEERDLFGTSVQLARRICDHAESGQILVSNVVRELAAGKGFLFADIGEVVPKGFEEPVRLYEVRWRE